MVTPLVIIVVAIGVVLSVIGIYGAYREEYAIVEEGWPVLAEKFGLEFIPGPYHLRQAKLAGNYRKHDIEVQRKAGPVIGALSSPVWPGKKRGDPMMYRINVDKRWAPVSIRNLSMLQFTKEALADARDDRFMLGEQYFDESLVIEGEITPKLDALLRSRLVVESLQGLHDMSYKLSLVDAQLTLRIEQRPRAQSIAKRVNEICDHVERLNRAIDEADPKELSAAILEPSPMSTTDSISSPSAPERTSSDGPAW